MQYQFQDLLQIRLQMSYAPEIMENEVGFEMQTVNFWNSGNHILQTILFLRSQIMQQVGDFYQISYPTQLGSGSNGFSVNIHTIFYFTMRSNP